MILKFLKKWSYYIISSFIVLLIVFIFLYPMLFMGDEAIERAARSDTASFILPKKLEVQDKLMANEPISSLGETPNWNKVKYFYRSTDGAMYIQTDKRAYFLVPVKNGDSIEWTCYSSDGSIAPFGCTFIDLNSQNT